MKLISLEEALASFNQENRGQSRNFAHISSIIS